MQSKYSDLIEFNLPLFNFSLSDPPTERDLTSQFSDGSPPTSRIETLPPPPFASHLGLHASADFLCSEPLSSLLDPPISAPHPSFLYASLPPELPIPTADPSFDQLAPFQEFHPFEKSPELEDPSPPFLGGGSGDGIGSSSSLKRSRPNPTPAAFPRCEWARRRRKRLSDRARSLEKLMPWERKMDTATLLEHVHGYVRFLEAQVAALEDMPALASVAPVDLPVLGTFSGLERLSRQQTLAVFLNSSRVQELLSSSGLCIFAVEQSQVFKKSLLRNPSL